ncbi:MAG: hypothetical protein LBT79_03595 [Elusimicrobiota bacterium]|jgi:hypothetical protein|nr:hypothetical protein [Elusimicrobiota bacterium]
MSKKHNGGGASNGIKPPEVLDGQASNAQGNQTAAEKSKISKGRSLDKFNRVKPKGE